MQLKTMLIVIATLAQLATAFTILTANSHFRLTLLGRYKKQRAGRTIKIMRGPLAGRFMKRL